jgi:carboxypeptidase C (cathepsin A)
MGFRNLALLLAAASGLSAACFAPAVHLQDTNAPYVDPASKDWVRTKHTITVGGETLHYTATAGLLPIKSVTGELQAKMFFVAYTLDGADHTKRPVLFAFNGGPGSSSVWLHMGALGPRRALMNDDGSLPKPPYRVADNTETWLPATDVIMVDAIGTGFSRTTSAGDRQFYGLEGDLRAFTAGIKSYITIERRWPSPLFVAGESYGGTRVAGLSDTLLHEGIAANGIISISGVMNFMTLDGGQGNDVPYLSFFPSEAATAWYHKKLSPKLEAESVDKVYAEAEAFTEGEYADALTRGGSLPADKRAHIVKKMSEFLGISEKYIERANLRVGEGEFMAELLRDQYLGIGRYDGRLTGRLVNANGGYPDFDASDAAVTPVFTSAFNQYIDGELKYHPDDTYRITGYNVVGGWDFGLRGGYPDTSHRMRQALIENPHMKILLCCGYYDLACPVYGMKYTINHLGFAPELKNNVSYAYFPAGHMMYIEKSSREKLAHDVIAWIKSATTN